MLLILGLILFLGVHSIAIVNNAWREQMIARFGEMPGKVAYGLVALLGLVLIVIGYGEARESPLVLYTMPVWMRHVALLIMLPVFPLLFAAYLPGRIQSATKHPMLVGVKLWAVAHLLANGTLADVLLFGGFLVWAIADRISLKRRPQPSVPGAPPGKRNDLIALGLGLVFYVAFILFLHRWLFGVSPIAMGG
jgi:uncharacterized membrane protein